MGVFMAEVDDDVVSSFKFWIDKQRTKAQEDQSKNGNIRERRHQYSHC